MTQHKKLQPVLKWVGGKRQLLDQIRPHIPEDPSLYVEPFVGGGAVWLDLSPRRARISDLNCELINMYRTVRDESDHLLELLEHHQELNSRDHYYDVRAWDRSPEFSDLTPVERAARLIYLNKTGYNGLYRVNSRGEINTPYGRYKNPNIVNREGIKALSSYLQEDIEILEQDYSASISNLPSNAFVYLDPPYFPLNATSSFTGYTQGGFDLDEQVRLRDACVDLREQGIRFVQSNSKTPEIEELYSTFKIITVQAKRHVNSNRNGRGSVEEVLIIG